MESRDVNPQVKGPSYEGVPLCLFKDDSVFNLSGPVKKYGVWSLGHLFLPSKT